MNVNKSLETVYCFLSVNPFGIYHHILIITATYLQDPRQNVPITKTYLYIILIPLNPTFCIGKLGFTGVYIILYLLKNIDCGY